MERDRNATCPPHAASDFFVSRNPDFANPPVYIEDAMDGRQTSLPVFTSESPYMNAVNGPLVSLSQGDYRRDVCDFRTPEWFDMLVSFVWGTLVGLGIGVFIVDHLL